MFNGFANVWTVIGLARDFPPGKLHARQVAGEGVVLFRDAAGTLGALRVGARIAAWPCHSASFAMA